MNKTCLRSISLAMVALFGVSCSTVYDSQGRARQVVRPEAAVAGIAAAGLIGYSISKNRHKKKRSSYYDNGYRDSYYRGGNDRRYERHQSRRDRRAGYDYQTGYRYGY